MCMKKNTRIMRKRTWTSEEDKLLKAYINKYGEGKWHLIPKRAGMMNVAFSTAYLGNK